MDRGFIKIWRAIEDWNWAYDLEMVGFFVRLVLMANWKDKNWQGLIIPRGSFVSSTANLADLFGLSYQQARNRQDTLKSTGELTTKSTNKYTIYTIVNYDKYQDQELFSTSKTTDETTIKQQATDSKTNNQTTTTKEVKNKEIRNKEEETTLYGFDDFWNHYPKKEGKGACRKIWAKLKPSQELLDTMLKAIENQNKSEKWQKDGGQYIPMPATWLNQERWDDEIKPKGDKYGNKERGIDKFVANI